MATHDDTQSAARGRMLEYAEFVEDQVARACARIKSNDVFRASLWLVTVGLAVLFLEIVLDHTVELPLVVRRSVFYGGLLLAAIYAALRIVRPMFLRVNNLYAAKSIESVDSHFKNSLINYLRLREDADKIPPSVLKSIEARAVNDLTTVNVDDVIDPSPVTRLSYALAAIVVGLCLYSWITPKNIWDSARRAFLADVARPTNTRFANVSPGDDKDAPKVVTGLPVNFSVETLGAQPETVTLYTSRDGGASFAETPMVKGRSFADPWTVTIEKAPGELHYYMAGGDGRTRTYHLEALPVAIVESVSLDYDFPAYARAPRREAVTDGNVEALQGTRVTVTATTNQPARSGLLDFGPKPPVALAPLPGEPRKLKGTFVVEANGQYSVRFNTVDGQTNPEPVLYDIRVVKDVSPTARFIRPETPISRPANARVPLVMEANDDFGITSAQLHVYKGGEILQQAVELVDPKSKEPVKQIQTTIALDLQPLSLKEGDRIQYWLALKDNCELQTNRFETPKQEIVIQPPVTQPEREQLAQNEMAQAKEDLGQQEPQPEDQPGQEGQNSGGGQNSKDQEKSGENQSGEQGKSGEERKSEEQGKQGQGKSGQGNETESAEPGDNAKSGGQQGKGQQTPSDEPSQGKNAQGKGQTGRGNDASNQGQQPDPKSGGTQGGDSERSKSERSEASKKNGGERSPMKNEPGEQDQNPPGESGKDERSGTETGGDRTKSGQPGDQEKNEKPAGERPAGSQESGKAEPGRKPDATERTKAQSGERSKGDPQKSQQGEQPKGEPGEESGAEKSKDANAPRNGDRQNGQPGPNEKNTQGEQGKQEGVPKGEPQKGEPNEDARQKSLDELTEQDREKLDRLRRALGMDDQPKPQAGQPGQGEESPSGQQSKSEDPNRSGQPKSADEEKGEQSKSGGQEKGEQSKSGGQEKGESSKSSGQEKGEQSKSGGQEKGEQSKSGGQEKGESSKSGGQEKGEQSKSGGQEKGEQSKSGGQEKGESSKSGGQEKGEQSKSGGQEKGESGKEAGKEKGEAGKEAGQEKGESGKEKGESGKEKGESGKDAGQEKGESGKQGGQPSQGGETKGQGESKEGEGEKSKDEGDQRGQPGGLPDGVPKNGGMREGSGDATEKADASQPSPRAIEPENQGRNDLSPQQKADQRVLSRLKQMVEKNEITKDIEEATGLSREEIDQFVRRYEAPTDERRSREQGGPGEIVTGPSGDERDRRVTLPGETPDGKVLSRTGRGSGMVKEDEMRGNLEGARSRLPSALRSRFEAYQKALSRSPGGGDSNAGGPSGSPAINPGTGSGTNR